MGVYVYKVSSKPCMKFQGEPVYKATYAYKPYWAAWDAEKINREMDFSSGAAACRYWWSKKPEKDRTNVLVKYYNQIHRVPFMNGTVYDDEAFDQVPVHTLPEEIK